VRNTGVSLSVAIMHVSSAVDRRKHVDSIVDATHGTAHVIEDTSRAGPWPTAKRAWERCAQSGSHALVIQDDAIPCVAFMDQLSGAIAARPGSVIGLYTQRRQAVAKARDAGSSWIWGPDAVYGVAIVMPVPMVDAFLSWERSHIRSDYPHDDNRVALWARSLGIGCWITCPQLVDHAQGPSLLRHRWANGGAPWPIGSDISAVDWSAGLMNPARLPASVQAWRALIDPEESRRWPTPSPY
jgi:hypothetical protein